MEQENNNSQRNISEKWINNNVYEAMELIERYTRIISEGSKDIWDYLQQMKMVARIPEVQYKTMGLLISEFEILIENTKEIITPDQYKDVKKKIQFLRLIYNQGKPIKNKAENKITILKVFKHIPNGKGHILLTDVYYELERELSLLRSEMISNLKEILYSKSSSVEMEELD